jgi:hypothetical protein
VSATVVCIDPMHPKFGVLASFYAQRVASYAREYQPEVLGDEFARMVLAKLWMGDKTLLALGICDDADARLLGHALASAEALGSRRWVNVIQLRADEGVGSARIDALKTCVSWAQQLGIDQVLVSTNRDGKEFQKLGFVRYRTGHRLSFTAPPLASPSPADPAV